MKLLTIQGYGASISVDGGRLIVKDGYYDEEGKTNKFRKRRADFDKVIVLANTGNISIDSIKWLLKQEKDIVILDWNGRLVTCLNSPVSRSGSIRISQYQTYCDEQKKLQIANSLIKAKIQNSLFVLTWIKSNRRSFRYNHVIEKYSQGIDYAKDIGAVREIEGDVAQWYWDALTNIIDDKFEFETRSGQRKPRNAIDPVNALLNYGYSVLESECWKAVNKVGLDAYVGFVHENYNNKASLVYVIYPKTLQYIMIDAMLTNPK